MKLNKDIEVLANLKLRKDTEDIIGQL